jgi:hypothetical protein
VIPGLKTWATKRETRDPMLETWATETDRWTFSALPLAGEKEGPAW